MGNMLNRDEYRKIKSFSKQEMEKWLTYEKNITYNNLRKEFEANYQDEVNNSVSNFLITIWYTLHFSDEVNLSHDELASFMDDLYVSVDLFRKGEYKPEDYKAEMEEDGIKFTPFEYTKLYDQVEQKYISKMETLQSKLDKIKEYMTDPTHDDETCNCFRDILNIIDGGI